MVGLPGASRDSAETRGCRLVGTISTVLKPAARRLSASRRAPRSISGLCSLLALTLGMRKSSQSSAKCWSRRPSIDAARFIRGPWGLRVISKYAYVKRQTNVAAAKGMYLRRTTRDRQTLFYDCTKTEYKRSGCQRLFDLAIALRRED